MMRRSRNITMMRDLIKQHTKQTDLCGLGIQLHLITSDCPLYHVRDEAELPFPEPWWAFCWPGGEALTRYILKDAPNMFKEKRILDIGSGCGSSSIACAMVGAKSVVANDIDPFAEAALFLNLEANGIEENSVVQFDGTNKIGLPKDYFQEFDIVLCGDMLYDPDHAENLLKSLGTHKSVIFGDPGRTYCPKDLTKDQLLKTYEYQKDGFDSIKVFKLNA